MAGQLEFFFDYTSPYSYLANSRIPGIAKRSGAAVLYRPVLLGAVIVDSGNTPPPTVPARAAYMPADLRRWAARYEIPFAFNPHFPMNGVRMLRAALAALEEGRFGELHEALFQAVWADRVNAADPEQLARVVTSVGMDAEALLSRIEEPEIKQRLKEDTAAAVARGLFGLPSFVVGDELFFGNDRLDFVEEALARA